MKVHYQCLKVFSGTTEAFSIKLSTKYQGVNLGSNLFKGEKSNFHYLSVDKCMINQRHNTIVRFQYLFVRKDNIAPCFLVGQPPPPPAPVQFLVAEAAPRPPAFSRTSRLSEIVLSFVSVSKRHVIADPRVTTKQMMYITPGVTLFCKDNIKSA